MPSRIRHSTARDSTAPTPGPSRSAPPNDQLPPYRKPSHPLNQKAQNHLATLARSQGLREFKEHNKQAAELISKCAEQINDALRDRESKVVKRRQKQAGGEEQELAERELEELKAKVEDMTTKLEVGMREAIDTEMAGQRMEEGFNWMRANAPGQLEREYEQQLTQRQTQQSQSQRRRTQRDENGDENMDEDDDRSSPGPTPLNEVRIALTGPSELFADRLERKKTEYLSLPHSVRYAKNNDYIGFKGVVHDSRFGDSGPALPHPDTWFTERGSPAPGITAAQNNADDDDDIVVDKATISTRCPLTYQKFREPLTSKKCPHSFEKNAILEYIRKSKVKIGGGPGRGVGEKASECPVSGCDQMLTVKDLWQDPILLRKIKRMQQAEAQEADEDDSDDEEGAASQRRPQELIDEDDDEISAGPSRQVKVEVHSTASQRAPRGTQEMVDLGEPSDDDDNE